MSLGPIQEFAYWQLGASTRVKGHGTEHNPYPPGTLPAEIWVAGWKSWDDYLLQHSAAAGPRFRFATPWWNGRFWNWQGAWFTPGAMTSPLLVAEYKSSPSIRSRPELLRELLTKHHMPGLNQDAITILRTPEGEQG